MTDPRSQARAALARHEAQNSSDPLHFGLANHLYVSLRALLDATEPTDDEREALRISVQRVLFNASNYPPRVQARMLGQDTGPLTDAVVDSVIAAGYRREQPVTDAEVEAAARALRCVWSIAEEGHPLGKLCRHAGACLDRARAALEAARGVRHGG